MRKRDRGFTDRNSSIVIMLAKTYSGAVTGVDGLVIRVEVDLGSGLTAFRMVGLPDAAVREAQVRVRSALANSGFWKCEAAITVRRGGSATRFSR